MLDSLFYRHKALIICGLIGLILGPIGAIIGIFIGYGIDRSRPMAGGRAANQAFFEACFLLMGYIAKADGRVSEKEIQYTRNVMAQLRLNQGKTQDAMALFSRGKQSDFNKKETLAKLRQHFANRPRMLAQFINILVRLAYINGSIDPSLKPQLQNIALEVGLGNLNFAYYDLMFGWQAHFEQARQGFNQQYQQGGQNTFNQPRYTTSLSQAYKILGIAAQATKNEVKRAYRKMMSKYHPDKLMSQGLNEEQMQKATEKAQQIKAAYEQICSAKNY